MALILDNRVLAYDDERDIGNGIIVTLRHGWRFDYSDVSHVQGFDTPKEAKQAIREAIKCSCKDCTRDKVLA